MTTLAGYPGLANLSPAGKAALIDVSRSIGVDPDWMGAVFQFESGFRKDAVNPYSGAFSFIQFMPSTLGNLGTSKAQVQQMSDVEVIRGPVYHYFAAWSGKLKTLDDTYLAVFYPAAIGKADDWVVARKGNAVYDQNAGFDRGNKGYITKGDIVQTIRGVYNSAKSAERVGVVGASNALAWFLLFGLLGMTGGAVAYSIQRGL